MKVMVMVPCYENIFPDTMKCIWDLNQYDDYDIDFDFVRGYTIDRARNRCVHRAKEESADYLLFVDNDMTFKPHYLKLLLEHEAPVVLGYYDHRPQNPEDDGERTNLCKLGQTSYIEQITPAEIKEARDEGYDLIEVKGGGLGFALLDMKIFEGFLYPYFRWVNYGDGECLSEDLYFSEQCARVGIPVYADTRCYCGHIFRQVHGGNND